MSLEVFPVKRPSWTPLPQEGCVNVYAKSLLSLEHLGLAMLRFDKEGTIHEHPADFDVDVICLEGAGFTSVAGEEAAIQAGERVRWPAGKPHRLWTIESEMITLMIEHVGGPPQSWEFADSSMITAYKYDAGKKELDVVFNRLSTYRYFDVPQEVVEKLRESPSKGTFLHAAVIDKFQFEKLEK